MPLNNPLNTEQAENALENSPVGGGTGVTPRYTERNADVIVSEWSELERADSNDVVYLADNETIQVTDSHFNLSGTALVGGRHKPGVRAGTLDVRTSGPGSASYVGAVRAFSSPGHVEGIIVNGPSWYPDRADEYSETHPTDVRSWPGYEHISKDGTTRSQRDDMRSSVFSRGINLRTGGTVRNCDVHGFTHAGVSVGTRHDKPEVSITRSKLHNCCMPGLGYPVNLYNGTIISEYNFYNAYRHSITGFGYPDCGYITRNDVHGPDAMLTPVDMHCLSENGSPGDLTAGKYLRVENCTFLAAERFETPGWYSRRGCPAVGIRGRPARGAEGYTTRNCHFAHDSEDDALDQRNVPRFTSWTRSNNDYSIENWSDGNGAPVDWTGAPVDDRSQGVERRRARSRAIAESLGRITAALS